MPPALLGAPCLLAVLALVAGCDPYLADGAPFLIAEPGIDVLGAGLASSSDAGWPGDSSGQSQGDAVTPSDAAALPDHVAARDAAPTADAGITDAAIAAIPDAAIPDAAIPDAANPDVDPAADAAVEPPQLEIAWFGWPLQTEVSSSSWGVVLTDVMQHCPPSEAYYSSDQVTQAHETTHGIDTHLGLTYTPWVGWNAFYVLEGRALLLREPGIRKAQVAPYVPQRFRRSRYDLYLVGQLAWDDHPLYVWEEWIAYTNGTAAGVDQAQRGLWTGGWRDACMGTLEFVVYGLAVGLAVEALDPAYLEEEAAFAAFLGFSLRRALDLYRACAIIPSFAWDEQDAYYQALRSGADGEPLRAFIRRTFGAAFEAEVLELASDEPI